jgi:uncharacterized oligopeptide transporter (OPT) family protein
MSRKINERGLIGIGICVIVFIIGELVLYRSTRENPSMGITIYILIGSTFKFTSVLGVAVILKYLYDSKKKKERRLRKRKSHKLYYLKDDDKSKQDSGS